MKKRCGNSVHTHSPATDTGLAVLRGMHAQTFGEGDVRIIPLKGDASDRRIFRLRGIAHSSIGILGPNRAENRAFIGFARAFHRRGLAVPEIYAVHSGEMAYLEEDLGDITLSMWTQNLREATTDGGQAAVPVDASGTDPVTDDGAPAGEQIAAMYRRVLEELVRFQVDAADAVDYDLCYQTREFSREAMEFDVRYFRTMFLEPLVRVAWDRDAFERDCAVLIDELLTADRAYFLYRDFQSRNVMICDGVPHFIDFQSGRRGALHYDVASLLYDSRGKLGEDLRRRLLAHYLDEVELRMSVDRAVFAQLFEGFAVLRLLQALGAFGNIGRNKGKPAYLDLIPSRLAALADLVQCAAVMQRLPSLRDMLTAIASDPESLTLTQ